MSIEIIPSAKRLIRSLRDIGYEFVDAVADIVDNSIEAEATLINITLKFDGEDSYLVISDNGLGMAPKEIQEALRFGSNRSYDTSDDLGRFGLGLKTASLSQCERLTVSSRKGEERVRINSYCWDMAHIEYSNRWEILKIENNELKDEVSKHLHRTTGTVVTWERLGRLLGYKYPSGEHARKQADQMVENLKVHLGMIFHRFLSGEVDDKRIGIYINDTKVTPWDPYSRGEKNTQKLEKFLIPIDFAGQTYNVRLLGYILPPQPLYSSAKSHLQASGPNKWNRQQGFYIYRSNRIIQAGGWCGLRTSDEHTKLARIAMFIPSQLDELFQVNVAKKHLTLPRELRLALSEKLIPIIQRAQDAYRDKSVGQESAGSTQLPSTQRIDIDQKSNESTELSSKHHGQAAKKNAETSTKIEIDLHELLEAAVTAAPVTSDKNRVMQMFKDLYALGSIIEANALTALLHKYMTTKRGLTIN